MKVTIIESSTVRPSQNTPNERIWLSNLDLTYQPFYAMAGYVYKSDGSPDFFNKTLLKESLSNVLVTFYPLAGRVVLDENGRREIDCNGEGITFVEAETDCPLDDYADIATFQHKLFPVVDFQRHFSLNPLILIQVTKFCCGGVFMAIRAHHNAVDGGGGTHFTNSWSELARGQPITLPPVFDRSFLRARDPPNPKFDHAEYDQPLFITDVENDQEPVTSLIKISIDLINGLKTKVNDKNYEVKYSTFEILTAHLWRCITKARNFDSDQPVTLIIPIDGRTRLNPDFPKGYSGNVIFYAKTVVSAEELFSEPLIKTIERVRKTIRQMNDDYMRSVIDYLEKKNKNSDQVIQQGQKYQGKQQLRRGSFFVNTWVGLPIFEADFGWGKPITMLPPKLLQGMATYLPCFNGEKDFPLFISLHEDHKKPFETLLYVLE